MGFKKYCSCTVIRIFLVTGLILPQTSIFLSASQQGIDQLTTENILSEISLLQSKSDSAGFLVLAERCERGAAVEKDSLAKADFYYFSGVCYLIVENYSKALPNLLESNKLRKRLDRIDDRYLKSLYNTGVAYYRLGYLDDAIRYYSEFIEGGTLLYGQNSSNVVSEYAVLIGALTENGEYKRVLDISANVLGLLKNNSYLLTNDQLCDLYHNIGVGHARMADYAKARIYLETSLEYFRKTNKVIDRNYINLINNLATVYGYLGLNEKEEEFFAEGISLAVSNHSDLSFNLINTYAINLGNEGRAEKGEKLLADVVEKAKRIYGADSRYFIIVLMNYAEYLRDYMNDSGSSIPLFIQCREYLDKHPEDVSLREPVIIGYSLALSKEGETVKALGMIQDLLFFRIDRSGQHDLYENPSLTALKPDSRTLRILRTKHDLLKDLYQGGESPEVLEALANTSESIISLLDKIRISISEEQSRIVLGDRYRDQYLTAINDFHLCYNKMQDKRFLEKIFEYTERCKAASLLAATRELNAIQFQIPADIAKLEQNVQREIGVINSGISKENEKSSPDKEVLADLNRRLILRLNTRDSLVRTFEKNFPGYYKLKYNVTVPSLKDIPDITGRNANYLNYVISDSVLYLFLVNRKHQVFLTQNVDSGFFRALRRFRSLLSDPSLKTEARTEFNEFQTIGYDLYRRLIEPVVDLLISGSLLISPDNLLSYIPFEVLLTSKTENGRILYRDLDYLMKEFDISYAYSASFIEELVSRGTERNRALVAFAPVYSGNLNIDSLFRRSQAQDNFLYDLPFSREEANYVAMVGNGVQYLGNEALESRYKTIAGNFGIIHLAMHTILNDQNPMNSAMVFSLSDDVSEDGLLHTWEVYGIPLKTNMVVLSSCNTGSGMLSTGEGILSLARGFLYSGSHSVVMSMWEIDDKSGTDVVKMFYDHLKKGKSKSAALKSARISYLKNATQLRSHPYYWSSLVIYGENSAVFATRRILILLSAVFFSLACGIIIYVWRRRYS